MSRIRLSATNQLAVLLLLAGLFLTVANSAEMLQKKQGPPQMSAMPKLPDVSLPSAGGYDYRLSSLAKKRFLMFLCDAQQPWESQVDLLVTATRGSQTVPIVVVLPSLPDMNALDRYSAKNLRFLADSQNQIGSALQLRSLPRLLFVAEGLSVAGNRRPVSSSHIEGIRSLTVKFSRGEQISKADLNLLSVGSRLPLLDQFSDNETVRQFQTGTTGKWLAVHFSAHCSGCVTELKSLKAMTGKKPPVLGITTSNQAEIEALLSEIGLDIPVVYDTDRSISDAHDVWTLPTAFLVDQDGKIADKLVGFSEDAFHRLAEQATATKSP